jgi:hypothetical protein
VLANSIISEQEQFLLLASNQTVLKSLTVRSINALQLVSTPRERMPGHISLEIRSQWLKVLELEFIKLTRAR